MAELVLKHPASSRLEFTEKERFSFEQKTKENGNNLHDEFIKFLNSQEFEKFELLYKSWNYTYSDGTKIKAEKAAVIVPNRFLSLFGKGFIIMKDGWVYNANK
jgi:hypothetical protein